MVLLNRIIKMARNKKKRNMQKRNIKDSMQPTKQELDDSKGATTDPDLVIPSADEIKPEPIQDTPLSTEEKALLADDGTDEMEKAADAVTDIVDESVLEPDLDPVPVVSDDTVLDDRIQEQLSEPAVVSVADEKKKSIPSQLMDKSTLPVREVDTRKRALDAAVAAMKRHASPRMPVGESEMHGLQQQMYSAIYNLLKKPPVEESRDAIDHILTTFWNDRDGIFNEQYIFRYIVDKKSDKYVIPENAIKLYGLFQMVANPATREKVMGKLVDLSKVVDGLDTDVAEKLRMYF
jgi:hypothetical protein